MNVSSSRHDVLDKGEVRLLRHLGDDLSVVGAARVSHAVAPEDASKGQHADERLIEYLMAHRHGSPFEHVVFQFYVKAPLFVVREWQRHRIASYNEQSGRYTEFEPEFYIPDHVRVPDTENRQGSVKAMEAGKVSADLIHQMHAEAMSAFQTYVRLMHHGMAREMARLVLPLNLYTSFWFTINARSLMNFLSLRNAPNAQWEIQEYARAIEADFATVMPATWRSFERNGRRAP